MKRNLEDKVVWITGAGSGIGQNAAVTLSKLGMKVILSGRNVKNLQETALKCENNPIIKKLDIADKNQVKSVAHEIKMEFMHIDILINCAGINIENRDWDNINENEWDDVFQTNINGLFYCCKSAIPMMKERQDGLIINISSWSGNHVSLLSGVSYTSSKHALNAMTETINMKYCNLGIRACALCPGEVSTAILDKRPKKLSKEQKDKMLQPDDLGETIAFICQMPKHVCINELTISPTWHRRYIADLGIEEL
ncbi:MAG: SDR family oxidoreductase [Alphaproteobacteria bacterium]|nr:SDR family oxidoreductase [Alphaproteobacteria bacterium]